MSYSGRAIIVSIKVAMVY